MSSASMWSLSSQRGGTDRLYKVHLSLSAIMSHPELQRLSPAQEKLCMKMKRNLIVLVVLLAYGAVLTQGSLWELQKMITQVTKKSALWNYNNYGCYCGLGGKGMPKDMTDLCCHSHDCCYRRLKVHGCNAKFNMYSYFYLDGKIYCGLGSWCKRESCRCDSDFVLCLKRHLNSYWKGYRFYRKSHCGNVKLPC